MNSNEISKILRRNKNIKTYFIGVKAKNFISNVYLKKFECIVINTCNFPQSDNKCHWVAVVNTNKFIYYFDSFGKLSTVEKDITIFLKKHKKKIRYNKLCLQNIFSSACGQFVCIFVYLFYLKNEIPKITDFFVKNKVLNEVICHKLFNYIKKNE